MKAQPSSARRPSDQVILSMWREQLAQATPGLSQTLVKQQPELLPCFAAYYSQLQQLPRRARRDLQRQCRRARRAHHFIIHGMYSTRIQSLASVALLLALGQAPALAATINVGGGCKLVDAITAANTDNAIGLCKAGSGADTLVLTPRSTHTLTTVNNTSFGPTGLPIVTSVITIDGKGSTIKRASGTPNFRIFAVYGTGNLTLAQTTVSGGVAVEAVNHDDEGGGILNYGSKLQLFNGTLSGNRATSGGGLYNRGGTVTLKDSNASGNRASEGARGVDNQLGVILTIANSVISGNSGGVGGVLNLDESTLTIANSTISGNTGVFGGVANASSSTLTLTNSTISGNRTSDHGGGILNVLSSATVSNSTISGNSATAGGGGVANLGSTLTVSDSTISGNSSGSGGGVFNYESVLTLSRTLIAGNTTPNGAEIRNASGTINAYNSNLFGHSGLTSAQALFGFVVTGNDILATSDGSSAGLTSIINPLANNGGLTETHALVSFSPAVDRAANCPSPKTDQRGVPRPQDGNNDGTAQCDIGAFERVRPGTVTCDDLPATRIGTAASETLNGTPGRDVIQGLGGNDLIRGLAGNDVVCGGSGNDRLFGSTGEDRLFGEAGTDRLDGELGFDRCDGGPATGDTAANCEHVSYVP